MELDFCCVIKDFNDFGNVIQFFCMLFIVF